MITSEAIAHSFLSTTVHSNVECQWPALNIVPEIKCMGLRTSFVMRV